MNDHRENPSGRLSCHNDWPMEGALKQRPTLTTVGCCRSYKMFPVPGVVKEQCRTWDITLQYGGFPSNRGLAVQY